MQLSKEQIRIVDKCLQTVSTMLANALQTESAQMKQAEIVQILTDISTMVEVHELLLRETPNERNMGFHIIAKGVTK